MSNNNISNPPNNQFKQINNQVQNSVVYANGGRGIKGMPEQQQPFPQTFRNLQQTEPMRVQSAPPNLAEQNAAQRKNTPLSYPEHFPRNVLPQNYMPHTHGAPYYHPQYVGGYSPYVPPQHHQAVYGQQHMQQMQQQQPQQQPRMQQKKSVLKIIDPKTGRDVLDNSNGTTTTTTATPTTTTTNSAPTQSPQTQTTSQNNSTTTSTAEQKPVDNNHEVKTEPKATTTTTTTSIDQSAKTEDKQTPNQEANKETPKEETKQEISHSEPSTATKTTEDSSEKETVENTEEQVPTGSESEEKQQQQEQQQQTSSESTSSSSSSEQTPARKSSVITYDRDYLLKFAPVYTEAPDLLKNLDIFKKDKTPTTAPIFGQGPKRNYPTSTPTGRGAPKDYGQSKFTSPRGQSTSEYFKMPRNKSSENLGPGGYGRGGYKGYGKGYPQPSDSFPPVAPLQKGENAWGKPRDITEEERIYKLVKGILNKITPETFEKLTRQILDIKIENSEVLRSIISLVFEKAVSEPNFATMYADLCNDISAGIVSFEEGKASFKRILLTKCQEEFEKRRTEELDFENLQGTEEEKFEQELKIRKRMVGNIKFIGELFKRNMLSEKIMHNVINTLLLAKELPKPEELEVLCKLMATIGKMIDHDKAKDYMDHYFGKLTTLSTNQELNSRIRFMIQDVMELRRNKWKPRRAEVQAKTIEEVHKQAEQDEIQKSKDLAKRSKESSRYYEEPKPQYQQKVAPYSKTTKELPTNQWLEVKGGPGARAGSNPGSSGAGRGGSYAQKGGKQQTGQKGQHGQANKNTYSAGGEMKLQPQSSFGGGAKGWSSQANIFSALSEKTDTKPQKGGNKKAGDSGKHGQKTQHTSKKETPSRDEQQKQKQKRAVEEDEEAPETTETSAALSDDELRKQTKNLLDEYMSHNDTKDAALSVQELRSPAWLSEFVSEAVLYSGERDTKARTLTSSLFKQLVDNKTLTIKQLVKGYETAICQIDEFGLVMDIPYIFKNMGQLLGHNVVAGLLDMTNVEEILEELADSRTSDSMVTDILVFLYQTVVAQKGVDFLKATISQTHFDAFRWLCGKRAEDTRRFVEQVQSVNALEADVCCYIYNAVHQHSDADSVVNWLKEHPEGHKDQTKFMCKVINALVTSIISQTTFSNRETEETSLLAEYAVLFKFAIKGDEIAQESLFAIQHFCWRCKSPQGLFLRIVTFLFDNKMLSKETLNRWKDNTDNTTQGKTEAAKEIESWLSAI